MAVIKHPEQRVGVFIDTQNLYHSAKNLYQSRVNFAAMLKEALAERKLIRARAYVVNTESGEEQPFFEALQKIGIEIKTKDLQIFYGGAKKADWDVGLAVDAITASQRLDAVILATGDGDFIPLVEYLQKHSGCQVELITFGRSCSGKLKDTVDSLIDMDDDPKKYLINYRASRKRAAKRTGGEGEQASNGGASDEGPRNGNATGSGRGRSRRSNSAGRAADRGPIGPTE
ncbi:MAG TPA: NYN domain-containing protein [Candidatus Paceibacterota bacterium]|nr:NYN domain-containing protein [Candidatus Paceibacterota bacterium]